MNEIFKKINNIHLKMNDEIEQNELIVAWNENIY